MRAAQRLGFGRGSFSPVWIHGGLRPGGQLALGQGLPIQHHQHRSITTAPSSDATILTQGTSSESAPPDVQGFYDNVVFETPGLLPKIQPKGLAVDLLPFQQEGVAWMMHREQHYTGGIMSDHLGMGKTVQMIGLCIAQAHRSRLEELDNPTPTTPKNRKSDKGVAKGKGANSKKEKEALRVKEEKKPSSNLVQRIAMPINTKPTGYRLLAIIQQMLKISAVGNCSRLTRPGRDLFELLKETEELLTKFTSNYDKLQKDLVPWLDFCSRYHPAFARRARSFLKEEEATTFAEADTPELRTLVVLPASLILQWKSELEKKVKEGMKLSVHIFHGPEGRAVTVQELESFDFVLTSYETVALGTRSTFHQLFAERTTSLLKGAGNKYKEEDRYFDREKASVLFHVKWKRVILDEAHMIRHSITRRWKAVSELQASKRWVVSATPLHNSIEDLQNLLQFINSPRLPIAHTQNPELLLRDPVLQRSMSRALQPLFLRRGPVMFRNGIREVLVQLPVKEEHIVTCELNDDETTLYNDILLRSQCQINSLIGDNRTLHLFAMMTRLRQTCCHPWLAAGRAVEVLQCSICKGEAHQPIVSKCGHSFCRDCLLEKFQADSTDAEGEGKGDGKGSKKKDAKSVAGEEAADANDEAENMGIRARVSCPVCDYVIPFSVFKKHHLTSKAHIELLKKKEWRSSSKLDAILAAINEVLTNYPKDKVVLFSHFTSFLDIIHVALDREGVQFTRLDGTMTLKERNIVIEHFGQDKATKVLLASKMAIGVGLNLTMANHVIVVDPWWNPAIEEQAVHRCHRIGQKKDVIVKRFIVNSTIEQYCHEVCQKKKDFGDAVLKAATAEGTDRERMAGLSRLDEVVGRLHTLSRKGAGQSHTIEEARKVLL